MVIDSIRLDWQLLDSDTRDAEDGDVELERKTCRRGAHVNVRASRSSECIHYTCKGHHSQTAPRPSLGLLNLLPKNLTVLFVI